MTVPHLTQHSALITQHCLMLLENYTNELVVLRKDFPADN